MFVRTAGARDLAAVAELLGRRNHAPGSPLTAGTPMAGEFGLAALRARLDRHRSEFLVADDGEALAGVAYAAATGPDDARIVVLELIWVTPEHRGRGVGGMLLEEIEASFFESELLRVEADVADMRTLSFLETSGFVRLGAASDTLGGSVLLEKALA